MYSSRPFAVCTLVLRLALLHSFCHLYSRPSVVSTPALLPSVLQAFCRLYSRLSAVSTQGLLPYLLKAFCRIYSRPSAVARRYSMPFALCTILHFAVFVIFAVCAVGLLSRSVVSTKQNFSVPQGIYDRHILYLYLPFPHTYSSPRLNISLSKYFSRMKN